MFLAGISYCDKTYRIQRSNYNCYVIEYTIDGEGVLEVDGEKHSVKSGDVFFLYKGKGHKYNCSTANWTKIWVVIYGEVADALFQSYLRSMPNIVNGLYVEDQLREIIQMTKIKKLLMMKWWITSCLLSIRYCCLQKIEFTVKQIIKRICQKILKNT